MKVAICIGHSRSGDDGAVSVSGMSEWAFMRPVGAKLVERLNALGVDAMLVDQYMGAGYGEAMGWLAGQLRVANVGAAVELHFNAADNKSAAGHEWLHWAGSKRGHALALALESRYARAYEQAKRRGVKSLSKSDRGALFLEGTHCPAVICEPFFGSNAEEWKRATSGEAQLVAALAAGIVDWVKSQEATQP